MTRKPVRKTPAQPKKKPVRAKAAKRIRAVKAVEMATAGASTPEIAAELGLSRSQAWRILRSSEVQQVLVFLVNGQISLISSIFAEALVAIREALKADRPGILTKKGALLAGGPDHYARMAAVTRLLQVMTAGRPKPPAPEESTGKRAMTLQEIQSRLGGSGATTAADAAGIGGARAAQPLR